MIRLVALLGSMASFGNALPVSTGRAPQWLRHYNLSVVPPRCGDINIEPLMPAAMDDQDIRDYAGCTIEEFSSFVLEWGECGQVGPFGNPGALSYTKRSNPASLGTPWLGPGGGQGGGPGDPGYPGTGGSFQTLCLSECSCSTSGHPIDDQGVCRPGPCPVCTDTNCVGRCEVCSPSFNNRLASNDTLVRLWCDPADPACAKNELTRPPENVRTLADFARGSPTRVKWTDHDADPPTSNLTIVTPAVPPAASRVNFATTAGVACFVCAVEGAEAKLHDAPGQTTFVGVTDGGSSGSQRWTTYENKGYSCTSTEFKGEIDTWRQQDQTAAGCLGAAITEGQGGDSYARFAGTVHPRFGNHSNLSSHTWVATIAPAFKEMDLSEYVSYDDDPVESGAIVVVARYPKSHHCYKNPEGGGSECHYKGFKLALTSLYAPRHHGDREVFGMYKADLGKAKSTTQGVGWTILRLPLTAFSSDWSAFTGECDTKDPGGYQHKCCDASSGIPRPEPCPTGKGLQSIIGLSIWSEGVLGDFELELKSISIEI